MDKRLEVWRERLRRWYRQWKSTLPAILMGIVVFLVCKEVGGYNVASVGMVFLFYLRGLWNRHLSCKGYVVDFCCVVLCALAGVAATWNYPLCLVINGGWMLAVTLWYGDDFQPRSYFLYGFALVLGQMNRCTPVDLARCVLACVLCGGLIALFVVGMKRRHPLPDPGEQALLEAFAELTGRLERLGEGPRSYRAIVAPATSYAKAIYGDVLRQWGKLNRGQSWYFATLTCLEQIRLMIRESLDRNRPLTQGEERYYWHLRRALWLDSVDDRALAALRERVEKLLAVPAPRHSYRWRAALQDLLSQLDLREERTSRHYALTEALVCKIRHLRQNLSLQNGWVRFAIKATVLNLLTFALVYPLPFVRRVWVPMTVYCILNVFHKDERKQAYERMVGTILGMLFFALVTEFIPGDQSIKSMCFLFLGFSLMFSIQDTRIITLIGTQISVQSLWARSMTVSQALEGRFFSILAAALCACAGGFLLFRVEKADLVHNHVRDTVDNLRRLLSGVRHGVNARPGQGTGELLLHNLLAIDATEHLLEGEGNPEAARCLEEILPQSYALQAQLIQLFLVLRHRAILGVERAELGESVLRLEQALDALKR